MIKRQIKEYSNAVWAMENVWNEKIRTNIKQVTIKFSFKLQILFRIFKSLLILENNIPSKLFNH